MIIYFLGVIISFVINYSTSFREDPVGAALFSLFSWVWVFVSILQAVIMNSEKHIKYKPFE